MAKANTTKAPAPAQAAPQAPTLYTLGKPYNPRSNTVHGVGGCSGTWGAVLAHLQANGGSATQAALVAVAVANGDPKFIGYCIGRQRLVPVAAPSK
jgi:hypothetical protein